MTGKPPVVLFIGRADAASGALFQGLRDRGIRVVRAEPGPETGDLARRCAPDLVVLDGHVESVVAGLVARLAEGRSLPPPLILAVPEDRSIREALRCRLGPLFYSARLVDPGGLVEVILSELGVGNETSNGPRKAPALLMCVDDDPLFLKSLTRILTHHGYRVVTCESARQALDVLPRAGPDLAIIDLMMPGMDGLELTDLLRRREKRAVPVVLLSALASDEACYEGHCRGASFFLTKPCEEGKILDVVDYLVGDLDEDERRALRAKL